MYIDCPFCGNKIKVNIKTLYMQKCPNCSGKFRNINKRKFNFITFVNIIIFFVIYSVLCNLLESSANILAFFISFLILNILEFIFILNINKLK